MKITLIFLFLAFIVSATYLPVEEFVEEDNNIHHLSSTLDASEQWTSDLNWMCFPAQLITLKEGTIIYDKIQKIIPELEYKINNLIFTFTLYPDYESFDIHTSEDWKELLYKEDMACLYAANLPNKYAESEGEYTFYLEKIKTTKGEWIVKPME